MKERPSRNDSPAPGAQLVPWPSGACDGGAREELVRTLPFHQNSAAACQNARRAIAQALCTQRLKHVRFQLRRRVLQRQPNLFNPQDLPICLNPIHVWSRWGPSGWVEEAVPRGAILFYVDAGEVHSALFELEGQALLNELADYEPCTLTQWAQLSPLAARTDLATFSHALARLGLVALL